MQITVAGKQVDLSDALRTRVSTQMDTIASKYFDHALEAHVTFSRARSFFTCDINVHAGRGLQLRGEGEAADANTAFDDAAAELIDPNFDRPPLRSVAPVPEPVLAESDLAEPELPLVHPEPKNPPAPKPEPKPRARKRKPEVPAWEDVLLGVRSGTQP